MRGHACLLTNVYYKMTCLRLRLLPGSPPCLLSGLSSSRAHKIFTHILRDWTSEGDSVRTAVYNPLLEALDDYVGGRSGGVRDGTAGSDVGGGGDDRCSGGERDQPERRRSDTRMANVLVPGAGLGRLAVEVAARGYASVHANELSTTS